MTLRGDRFFLDLAAGDEQIVASAASSADPPECLASEAAFVKDICERIVSDSNPPHPPRFQTAQSAFPPHRKRRVVSKFREARKIVAPHLATTQTASSSKISRQTKSEFGERQRQEIHNENLERLASMSITDIVRERDELFNGLSSSLISRLLQRSSIDDETKDAQRAHFHVDSLSHGNDSEVIQQATKAAPSSASAELVERSPNDQSTIDDDDDDDDDDKARLKHEHIQASVNLSDAQSPPSLDPSSPGFFDALHETYFPDLPKDPYKFAWMSDSTASKESYSPMQKTMPFSALRFSFAGLLLLPAEALQIPVTEGLHHHGEAPESAGYTIPELAHLSRSSNPAQRCIAYQTLGRILYRLGMGEFGEVNSDTIAGLWACIDDCRVLETMREEARKASGHSSARAYAVEALRLLRTGSSKRVVAE